MKKRGYFGEKLSNTSYIAYKHNSFTNKIGETSVSLLNDLFQESNRATISGRGGRKRGERGGGFEKLESNFANETTIVVVLYFYARARARLQVHDRKLNTVEGPWQTRSSATLGESGQRRPLYRESFFDVGRKRPTFLSPLSAWERKRVEAKYRAIMARDAHKPVSKTQLFRPRSPSTTLLSRKKEDRRLPRIGNPRGGSLAKVRCQKKASGNRVERDVASR